MNVDAMDVELSTVLQVEHVEIVVEAQIHIEEPTLMRTIYGSFNYACYRGWSDERILSDIYSHLVRHYKGVENLVMTSSTGFKFDTYGH